MELMVCGFLFNKKKTHVALILKNKPEWQKGKFNGIGGHVGENEAFKTAMEREFKEETGVQFDNWFPFAQGISLDREKKVVFWRGFSDEVLNIELDVAKYFENKTNKNLASEQVMVAMINSIDYTNCIPNLSWLIPLALDDTTAPLVKFRF